MQLALLLQILYPQVDIHLVQGLEDYLLGVVPEFENKAGDPCGLRVVLLHLSLQRSFGPWTLLLLKVAVDRLLPGVPWLVIVLEEGYVFILQVLKGQL